MASKAAADVDTDDGSLTPSEPSDGERSEHDSDYETEHEEETEGEQAPNVVWTGYGKKTPVILFKGEAVIKKKNDYKAVGERYHMAFKMGSSDCRIVRTILNTHGLREVHPNSSDYNIMWTGSHLKPFTLRSLTEFQKVNHFPRSYEITRKDRLFKNVQRMQQIKGTKHFDFVAQSFIMPTEYQEFCSCFIKEKGTWIVKPVASSRGRGVFLVNHPDQVPLDENVIVSKYIANPILIDGFKFDVRLYVAVTSYDPIVIYLYEEGLTRFATVKYEKANKHLRNQCMHLTNYSVNKKNKDYVQNDDPDIEDYGNKWSMGALLRYLKSQKKDVTALMMRIEDVIIKTIMSAEMPIATACKMFMPFRGNCFELYGFDILIDDHLKPWVLEVNLSPSLACDAPLDLKIKANMISDLLSLSGLMCQDPVLRSLQQSRRNHELSGRIGGRIKSAHIRALSSIKVKPRPQSAGGKLASEKQQSGSMAGLTGEEIKIVRRVKEEEERKGGWVRIFPSPDSWDLYGPLLQFSTTHNAMLHQRLYPERHKGFVSPLNHKSSATSIGHRNKLLYSQLSTSPLCKLDFTGDAYGHALLRTRQYLRKLNGGSDGRKKQRRRRAKSAMERRTSRRPLAQGLPEEDGEGEGEETDGAELEPPVTSETSTQKQTQAITCAKEDKGPTKQQKITAKLDVVDQTAKPQPQVQVQEQAVSTPKLNVMEMLVQGEGALNKVQARTAFAMYLIRVHQRLLSECNSHSVEDVEAMNEQMDLVLRFLKRAAVNLHQTFKVIVPSRKLPLNERRRILAKQLSDFVHVYTKETEQLRNKAQGDKKSQRNSTSKEGINEEKFERFINIASETELEEVLTTYTKLNKSASIFLGTKSPRVELLGKLLNLNQDTDWQRGRTSPQRAIRLYLSKLLLHGLHLHRHWPLPLLQLPPL
ncbi:tubulin polyglutamylase TTLL5-like isoform X2 [Liolophura sinensis]|uniref:tubulin polyglutamylase TTLL5-like isoform X2 n=1 Tax=Liolophura sinensis TaxID=3198878 RepID=UPI003158AE54